MAFCRSEAPLLFAATTPSSPESLPHLFTLRIESHGARFRPAGNSLVAAWSVRRRSQSSIDDFADTDGTAHASEPMDRRRRYFGRAVHPNRAEGAGLGRARACQSGPHRRSAGPARRFQPEEAAAVSLLVGRCWGRLRVACAAATRAAQSRERRSLHGAAPRAERTLPRKVRRLGRWVAFGGGASEAGGLVRARSHMTRQYSAPLGPPGRQSQRRAGRGDARPGGRARDAGSQKPWAGRRTDGRHRPLAGPAGSREAGGVDAPQRWPGRVSSSRSVAAGL